MKSQGALVHFSSRARVVETSPNSCCASGQRGRTTGDTTGGKTGAAALSLLFFLGTFLTIGLLPATPAQAAETLVLCLEKADVRPWRTAEGGGLNIELLNRVAKRLDLGFEYRGMPWKRCLAQLKSNEVSGAIGASFKAERLEIGVYPGGDKPDVDKRLNFDRYVLIRRRDSAVQWDGKSFKGLDAPIGVQLGYSIADNLRAMKVEVDEGSQRANELALKLIAGRISAAAMLDGEAATLIAGDAKLAAQLEILHTPLVEKPYFLILSHALHSSKPDLTARIWNTIRDVRNSPDYQKLEHDAHAGKPK
ncbi:hypothetical protein BH11PSE11_BH11PSE11_37920 [soil metagenome]